MSVSVVSHPAIADRLARLRARTTSVSQFRLLVEELGEFLAYEATRTLVLSEIEIATPNQTMIAQALAERPLLVPILRAGLGLVPGFLRVIPEADVAHLGMYRDHKTLAAIPYYVNLPNHLEGRSLFVLDPMLATGHSLCAAIENVISRGAEIARMQVLSLIAAPEGIALLEHTFPGVRISVCALDTGLNTHGYILPGLGDAGDRMFGSATSTPQHEKR